MLGPNEYQIGKVKHFSMSPMVQLSIKIIIQKAIQCGRSGGELQYLYIQIYIYVYTFRHTLIPICT